MVHTVSLTAHSITHSFSIAMEPLIHIAFPKDSFTMKNNEKGSISSVLVQFSLMKELGCQYTFDYSKTLSR